MLMPKPELRGCQCAKKPSRSPEAIFPKNGLGEGGAGGGKAVQVVGETAAELLAEKCVPFSIPLVKEPR